MPPARKLPLVSPARHPEREWKRTRLLAVDRHSGRMADSAIGALPARLRAGDLLVLNDAATLPASLRGRAHGQPVELRLASTTSFNAFPSQWIAVLFGSGDWRTDTDRRDPGPKLAAGDAIEFDGLSATVLARHVWADRLLTVRFNRTGSELGDALYAIGRPVQYAYLNRDLELHEVQTPYATRPWAIEMPSTGRPLRWPLLSELQRQGVRLAWLTEAAGLSATGDARLDRALPLAERYDIPVATAQAVAAAKRAGRRVIAVGTTVVRALEASAGRPGPGLATQRIDADTNLSIVDALLTGVHSPGESHWDLLQAFAPSDRLYRAHQRAAELGYLAHEHGDLMLL